MLLLESGKLELRMKLSLLVILAMLLDFWLGEPRRWQHPLVGFGWGANWWEKLLQNPEHTPAWLRSAGFLALCAAVLPLLGLWSMLLSIPQWRDAVAVLTLYFCIAPRSLKSHAVAIDNALTAGDEVLARLHSSKTKPLWIIFHFS